MSLATDSIADLAEVLNTDDFGTSAVFKAIPTDSGATITVVFVNEFDAALQNVNPHAETAKPFVVTRSTDVSGVKHGSTLLINTVTYNVVGVEPATVLTTKLDLSRQ